MNKSLPIGVFLDMNAGTLSFTINNIDYGVAFTNNALKKGPLYPAISLLKAGGCTIKKLPIPHQYRKIADLKSIIN